jgi:O-antigen/teichoic acid export membrane protein
MSLDKPRIRLKYAGFISFSSQLYSLLTGLIFSVMVARKLPVESFGVWSYLLAVFNYFMLVPPLIGYWIIRFTARGRDTGGAALILGVATSTMLTSILIALSSLIALPLRIDLSILMLLAIQLFVSVVYASLEWLSTGLKPEAIAYSYMVFESLKVTAAFILVFLLQLGVEGAIASIIIGLIGRIITTITLIRKYISLKFNSKIALRAIKDLWLPLYGAIPGLISRIDAILIASLTGSREGLAFIAAVQTVGSTISYSLSLASALYPKLLAEKRISDVEEALRLVFVIAIPLCAGVVILAPYLLSILRIDYVEAYVPLAVYALTQLFLITGSIASTTLSGLEDVDLDENARFKDYVKSRIFKVASIGLFSSILYIAVLLTTLNLVKLSTPMEISLIWVMTNTTANIASTTCLIILIRKLSIKTPWRNIFNYVLSTAIMAIPVIILKPRNIVVEAVTTLKNIAPTIIIGALTYFIILYIIDQWFRELISKILIHIKPSLRT